MTVYDLTATHFMTAMTAAFLASAVEFVEALTVVLAVGAVRGWRHAIAGALSGAAVLVTAILFFGRLLVMVDIDVLRLTVGILLLLFGMRWLHKAVLRQAGVVALHDEEEIYAREVNGLRAGLASVKAWDPIAFATAFKAVVLEGLEVVFIVVAVSSTAGALMPASLGAALAGVLIVGAAVVVHRPLTRVPENVIKFAVGVLISAFGVFWIGEGLSVHWPGGDLAIVLLATTLLAMALWSIPLARYEAGIPPLPRNRRSGGL